MGGGQKQTSGGANFDDLLWSKRPWRGAQAYAESKLYDAMLAFAVARIWPKVHSNALEPGWVATRMGGSGATGDMSKAHVTQAWLAVSSDALALSSGEYFFHKKLRAPNPIARDEVAMKPRSTSALLVSHGKSSYSRTTSSTVSEFATPCYSHFPGSRNSISFSSPSIANEP